MTQYLAEPGHDDYREAAVEAWHQSLELNPDQPKLRPLLEKYRVKTPPPPLSIN